MNRPNNFQVACATIATTLLTFCVGCGGGSPDLQVPVSLASMNFDGGAGSSLAAGELPTVAVNATGDTIFMAYFTEADGKTEIQVSRRDPASGAWGSPVTLDTGDIVVSAHAQAPAQVATGPSGAVYVAWTSAIKIEGRRFDASNLYLSRSTDGGKSFLPPVAVNSDSDGLPSGHTFHDIAVAGDGTIYISWLDSREKALEEAKAAVTGVEPAAQTPAHSMSGDGTMDMSTISGAQIWVATSHDGGATFTEGTTVAKSTCQCCRTSLAIGPDGAVYVAWRHIYPGEQRDMAIAKSTDRGQTFSDPVRIHNDEWEFRGCPHSGPSIAVDSNGGIHAAWYTGTPSGTGLYYAFANSDLRFGEPTPLVEGVGVSQVSVAGDGSEVVWVSWVDMTSGSVQVGRAGTDGKLHVVGSNADMKVPSIAVMSDGIALVGDGSDGVAGVVSAGLIR